MKQRKWDSKAKAKIFLEGIKGVLVAWISSELQFCVSQYYQWRDPLLSNLNQAFNAPKKASREARLESEILKPPALVGELTLELKKQTSFFMRKFSKSPA